MLIALAVPANRDRPCAQPQTRPSDLATAIIPAIEGVCIGQLVRRYKRFLADVVLPDSTASLPAAVPPAPPCLAAELTREVEAVESIRTVEAVGAEAAETITSSALTGAVGASPASAADVGMAIKEPRRTRARAKAALSQPEVQDLQGAVQGAAVSLQFKAAVTAAAAVPVAAPARGKRGRAAMELPTAVVTTSLVVPQVTGHAEGVVAVAATEDCAGLATTVHCPNTGPMTGLLDLPLAQVVCSVAAVKPGKKQTRKYAHTLEAIQPEPGGCWVGVHSALANKLTAKLLECGHLKALLGHHTDVQQEVTYGKDGQSRVDFVLTMAQTAGGHQGTGRMYVEVKSVTLATSVTAASSSPQLPAGAHLALFPDTVSVRAQKHVQDLMGVVAQGHQAAMVFLVQRTDCTHFSPCEQADPVYAQLVRQAASVGVQMHALSMEVRPVATPGAHTALEFWYLGPLKVVLYSNHC